MSAFVMTASERETFLAGAHIGVIAVNRAGRAPLTVPIWYGYEPGGEVSFWTGLGSVKDRLIRAERRLSLCAQDAEPPYRYVTAEGPVVAVDEEPSFEDAAAIARRYLPREQADGFVKDNAANHVIVRMRPERWLSTDYGKA